MDGSCTFKFISIKLLVWFGVAEVYSMSCLLIQLLTDLIQSVAIGSVVSDRWCELAVAGRRR